MSERILIVDADCLACELLQFKFENEGFKVDVEHDCHAAMQRTLSDYNLLLVDMMDADFNGIKFTREVRENSETANLPIILLTARASEDNVVNGLDAGADDFMQKPFSTRELVARIRSVLRRRRVMSARRMSNIMRYKGLTVDFGVGTVTIDGAPLMLLRHRNQFFERAEIQHEAWEEDGISERAVDTNISRLRKKLGEYGRNIVNRQGFGYGFIE